MTRDPVIFLKKSVIAGQLRCQIAHVDQVTRNLCNDYLESIRIRCLSPRTLEAYGFDLVYFLRWLKSVKKQLHQFTRQDMFEFTRYQVDQKCNPQSVNRRLSVCELFFGFARDCNAPVHETMKSQVSSNYRCQGAQFPWVRLRGRRIRLKTPRTIVEPLQAKDVNKFMAQVYRYRDISIILLMTLVGLRRCEVLAIELHDIDFDANNFRIKGKGRKERFMPLPELVMNTLKKYLNFERPPNIKTSELFVVLQGKRRGEPMSAAGIRSFFRRNRVTSKVPKANAHRLRHSFAYSMICAGVTLPVLQKMLGHSCYSTTLRYVSLRPEDVAEQYLKAMEKIQKQYAKEEDNRD